MKKIRQNVYLTAPTIGLFLKITAYIKLNYKIFPTLPWIDIYSVEHRS
jgi:hypothetical protein